MDLYFAKSEKDQKYQIYIFVVQLQCLLRLNMKILILLNYLLFMKKLLINRINQKEGDFDLVGGTLYDMYNLILINCFIEDRLNEKNYKYLKKLCLYLSKMVLYDYEICGNTNYTLLAAAQIFAGFKIVEQLDSTFNADNQIKDIALIIQVDLDQLIELAAKVLNLAKNFEKHFPNLENQKKFNGFQLEDDEQ